MIPFLTPPALTSPTATKIGDAECGTIALATYGYLTLSEVAEMEGNNYKESELGLPALELIETICSTEGISVEQAASWIDQPTSDYKLLSKYKDSLSKLLDLQLNGQAHSRLSEIAIFLRHRLICPANVNGTEIIDPNQIGCDVTAEEVRHLHPRLFAAICGFLEVERSGNAPKPQPGISPPSSDESSKPETTSKPARRTGKKSTGESQTASLPQAPISTLSA